MTIKCLTFDLDDTLWAIYPVIDRAEQKFLDWLETELPRIATAFTRQTLSSHRHAYFKRFPELHHDLTQLRKNWSKALMEEFDYENPPENDLVEKGFTVFWQERNSLGLFDGVEPVLGKLQSQLKLGAVTNGNADLQQIGISGFFDFYLTSAKAGVTKPNREIFQQTIALANCRASEIIHIGDDPVRDMEGAANCGFKTIWVNLKGQDWQEVRQTECQPDAIIESILELPSAVDWVREKSSRD